MKFTISFGEDSIFLRSQMGFRKGNRRVVCLDRRAKASSLASGLIS